MILHKFLQFRFTFKLFKTSFQHYRRRITLHVFPLRYQNTYQSQQHVKWIPVFAFLHAAIPENNQEKQEENKLLLDKSDELFNANKYAETYKLLKDSKDLRDVEVLWRLSRALYNQSKQESDSKKKKALVVEAFQLIKSALALDSNNFAVHKWYSILLDTHASYEGIKARINELPNVKKHMLKAAELNPLDATTLYMLGTWCYGIADMPWYQRKIASTLFASPPTSSYEEALIYFLQAEEVEPNFYSLNLLMLGKIYMKLQNQEKAYHYLKLASTYPAKTDEDFEAKKEAEELLKKIKH